jgi:peptidoglycan/xylan/chitin deacetylase (PgdA/CDA1 family)
MIEEKTGREVYALCYPNGDFGKREKKLAGDAGYRCAFTGRHGFVREGDDPFALRRISINDDVDIHEFIARVTGVRGLLKRIGL